LRAFAQSIEDVAREIATKPRTRIYMNEDGIPVSLDPSPIPVKEFGAVLREEAESEDPHDLIMEGGVDFEELIEEDEYKQIMDLVNTNGDAGSKISWQKNDDGSVKMTPYMEQPPEGYKLETFDRDVFREQLKTDISSLIRERYIPNGMQEAEAQKVEKILFKIVDKEFEAAKNKPVDPRVKAMEYSVFPENMIKDKVILMSISAGCKNKCLKA